ncbi:hypothetical protein AGMMS49975_30200 [Clostridia bacterium]|nr:hypothetical protein AGMMS49975_30200 [Clostridia bacterium]
MSAQYQEETDNYIVDLLLDEKEEIGDAPTFWLIDMGIAKSSAYFS